MCDQCNAMAHELAARDRELAQARREIEQQKRRIMRLLKVVQVARGTCARYIREADQVLNRRSGVPRAEWAYNKAQRDTAFSLFLILSQAE